MLRATVLLLVAAGMASADDVPPQNLPAITVSEIRSGEITDTVIASGLIAAVERVQVQPQIEGQAIDRIAVDVGDRVQAGDILAVLSTDALTLQKSQLEASMASAEAAIAQAEAQRIEADANAVEARSARDRSERLLAQGTTTKALNDQAVAAATSAGARVTVAEQGLAAARAQRSLVAAQTDDIDLKLRRTGVAAPVSGEVVEKNAMLGGIASGTGPAMFEIARDGLLELRADVAEQDILRLRAGQTARMTVVGLREPLDGTVRLVEPTVDPVSRLGRVRIEIAEPERVRAGMFAEAAIVVVSKEALLAPVSAVNTSEKGTTALRVSDGLVAEVPISTGIREGGNVEITAGLAAGETIVTKAGAFVRDGDRINPVPAAAATASN